MFSPLQEYYGRNVGVKIMPTGVNCDRLLAGLQWRDTIWRRGELKVLSIQIRSSNQRSW